MEQQGPEDFCTDIWDPNSVGRLTQKNPVMSKSTLSSANRGLGERTCMNVQNGMLVWERHKTEERPQVADFCLGRCGRE